MADSRTPNAERASFDGAIAAAAGLRAGSSRTVTGLGVAVIVLLGLLGVSVLTSATLAKGPREIVHTLLVDRVSGEARFLTAGEGIREASADAFVQESWLVRYVVLRERYLWETVEEDARLVGLLSAPPVERAYDEWVRGPLAPAAQYRQKRVVSITIDSVEVDEAGTVGRVRFTRNTRDADEPPEAGTLTRHSATVGFRFADDAVMYAGDRRENPLAFQVEAYDVVGETSNRELSS